MGEWNRKQAEADALLALEEALECMVEGYGILIDAYDDDLIKEDPEDSELPKVISKLKFEIFRLKRRRQRK